MANFQARGQLRNIENRENLKHPLPYSKLIQILKNDTLSDSNDRPDDDYNTEDDSNIQQPNTDNNQVTFPIVTPVMQQPQYYSSHLKCLIHPRYENDPESEPLYVVRDQEDTEDLDSSLPDHQGITLDSKRFSARYYPPDYLYEGEDLMRTFAVNTNISYHLNSAIGSDRPVGKYLKRISTIKRKRESRGQSFDYDRGIDHLLPYPLKANPSAEPGIDACPAYRNLSCCSIEQSDELMLPIRIHSGIRWNLCGDPDPQCNAIMASLECFHECSPYISYWHTQQPHNLFVLDGDVKGAPLCSDFCDAWFDVCRNEKTCAKRGDWINGLNILTNNYPATGPVRHFSRELSYLEKGVGRYKRRWPTVDTRCPEDSMVCERFSKVYRNGQNLCNILWGSRYAYSHNTSNCFDPRSVENHESIWQELSRNSARNQKFDKENYKNIFLNLIQLIGIIQIFYNYLL